MITFQEESYTKFFSKEFMELYKLHWEEIGAFNKQKIRLLPDWDVYRAMGKQNRLITFTVREDSTLIGYSIFILANHHHYKATSLAENDILYLKPEFRKGLTGYRFIKYCVEKLKKEFDVIILSMKAEYSFEPIVKRLGFKLTDYKFTLEI